MKSWCGEDREPVTTENLCGGGWGLEGVKEKYEDPAWKRSNFHLVITGCQRISSCSDALKGSVPRCPLATLTFFVFVGGLTTVAPTFKPLHCALEIRFPPPWVIRFSGRKPWGVSLLLEESKTIVCVTNSNSLQLESGDTFGRLTSKPIGCHVG